ncbi:MAG: hypothetical protein U0350_32595 [Caldilineaceae bacterium]
MSNSELDILQTAIRRTWPSSHIGDKARGYVGQFFECTRIGTRISAKVQGNHGVYTVSIRVEGDQTQSACSCYIGQGGYCHHCAALAITFLNNPAAFQVVERKAREQVHNLTDLHAYLANVTLESLLQQLKERGVTQTAFAQSIGSSVQHLGAVKRSELRNHFYHELGAMKLACLWVLEHLDEFTLEKKGKK